MKKKELNSVVKISNRKQQKRFTEAFVTTSDKSLSECLTNGIRNPVIYGCMKHPLAKLCKGFFLSINVSLLVDEACIE